MNYLCRVKLANYLSQTASICCDRCIARSSWKFMSTRHCIQLKKCDNWRMRRAEGAFQNISQEFAQLFCPILSKNFVLRFAETCSRGYYGSLSILILRKILVQPSKLGISSIYRSSCVPAQNLYLEIICWQVGFSLDDWVHWRRLRQQLETIEFDWVESTFIARWPMLVSQVHDGGCSHLLSLLHL